MSTGNKQIVCLTIPPDPADESHHSPVSFPGACRPAGPWCSAKHQSAYKSLTGRHQAAPGARNRWMTKEKGKERRKERDYQR